MKNILKAIALVIPFAFAVSCQEADDMITLNEPQSFTLLNPVVANTILDLSQSTSFELVCEGQPDYGFNAGCEYVAEASLSQDFSSFVTLESANLPVITIDAASLAAELTTLSGKPESEFPYTTAVYFRVKASIAGSAAASAFNKEVGTCYSNIVSLNSVRLSYALPPVVPPAQMYLIGGFCGWSWENAFAMVPEWYEGTPNGTFWRMIYFDADAPFKFNFNKAWDGNEVGFAGVDGRITDNAGAGITKTDDGNIVVTNAGWYLVVVRTTVVGRDYQYSIAFEQPTVYLFGPCNGGNWGPDDAWKFSVPADGNGEFVSPAFAADGEVRACVIIDPDNWWHSEFIVFGTELAYRGIGPDQERVNASAGQKMYINFTNGTGAIK